MSMGEKAGLGISIQQNKLKARNIIGCYKINSGAVALPRLLCITRGGGDQPVASESNESSKFRCLAAGRVKKFGIYLKTVQSFTGDAELVLRKNLADFGTPVNIPQATPNETTILSPNNLDLEFAEGDELHLILRMVSGTGSVNMSWSVHFEWDSDSDGEFTPDIYEMNHITPVSLSIRRNVAIQGNWISIDLDQPVIPALYAGDFKAVAAEVPTGFNMTTTHLGRAYKATGAVQTSYLDTNFIIGETGVKITLGDGTQVFVATDTLGLQTGQSGGGTLEPCNTMTVFKLDVPE